MASQLRAYWKNRVLNFFDARSNEDFTKGVWADCPLLAIQSDPSIGYIFREDWTKYDGAAVTGTTLGGYTCTQATTGQVALSDAAGAVLQVDSNSTTQHQGLNVQQDQCIWTPAANKDLWFEARFKVADHPSDVELFVGLAQTDTSLNPSGDLDSGNSDYIGFGIETTKGPTLSLYANEDSAGSGNEASDEVGDLSDDTYVRYGFKITSNTGIQAWLNDAELTLSNVDSDHLSDQPLCLSLVCQSDGNSKDPILHLDYVQIVQLR